MPSGTCGICARLTLTLVTGHRSIVHGRAERGQAAEARHPSLPFPPARPGWRAPQVQELRASETLHKNQASQMRTALQQKLNEHAHLITVIQELTADVRDGWQQAGALHAVRRCHAPRPPVAGPASSAALLNSVHAA